jgi:hypothetical protein
MTLLERTDHATYCPYKGDCAYYSSCRARRSYRKRMVEIMRSAHANSVPNVGVPGRCGTTRRVLLDIMSSFLPKKLRLSGPQARVDTFVHGIGLGPGKFPEECLVRLAEAGH